MVSSLLNPHCARRPTPAAVASAAGHNPETGGAPSFNNCRRARFARRAALGDAQGMSLGPGAANNSVEDRSGRQPARRLVSRSGFGTHREFDQPPSCQQVLVQGLRQETPRRFQIRSSINCHALRSQVAGENSPAAPRGATWQG
jgi:hypothetical protein